MENFVTIRFPDGRSLAIEHHEDASLKELLPLIAKHYRIRLYTDEYEFLISAQDQKLLSVSLLLPIFWLNAYMFSVAFLLVFS
jgi:hypothetical protein